KRRLLYHFARLFKPGYRSFLGAVYEVLDYIRKFEFDTRRLDRPECGHQRREKGATNRGPAPPIEILNFNQKSTRKPNCAVRGRPTGGPKPGPYSTSG